MTPDDLLRLAGVSDAQISPDDRFVVYVLSTVDGNETRSNLWISNPTSKDGPQRMLADGVNAANPRWSPDGRDIAFRATINNQRGLWAVAAGNRQRRLIAQVRETNFFITYAGEPFSWSPDSRRIAYLNASEDETQASEEASQPSADPRVVDRIQYKSRTSFSDNARTHVWIADVDFSNNTATEPRHRVDSLERTIGWFDRFLK